MRVGKIKKKKNNRGWGNRKKKTIKQGPKKRRRFFLFRDRINCLDKVAMYRDKKKLDF